MTAIVVILAILVLLLLMSIRIVPQANAYVIERLGRYKTTWAAGIHLLIPIIDRISRKVTIKEQVADFAPQPVITKDNVTMQIDSIVYFKIFNPQLYTYGVESPIIAIENLTATTLRNIIGDMTLDETLTSRDQINSKMLETIDAATDPWGIKINRVELKNINPPAAIRESMEKQMKAEREKRAAILTAEGEKQSMILEAQGRKESAVLNAEAEKQATILAAEAQKEKEIKEAEGKAEAIRAIQDANAYGIEKLKQAGADMTVLRLKSLETLEKVADGQATKIIVPSEIQNLAGLVESVKEIK
ncbi:SPFH domain-containing protein [Lachnospira multipara]|uniref:SPFH domain-containing protein n=1 Tax=Lachnospira multipara TaxID=28051 RepID=UPI0004E219B3|nr:SPFH domain-containing protein [Lachnospira multipara]